MSGGLSGLVMFGPDSGMTATEIENLLTRCDVEGIEIPIERMRCWSTAANEVVTLTRRVSQVIRAGNIAVVFLGYSDGLTLTADDESFVCARLARVLMGIADQPDCVVLHGEQLGWAVVRNALGDDSAPVLSALDEQVPVWQLAANTMFPGTPVAVCPDRKSEPSVGKVLDWLESLLAA